MKNKIKQVENYAIPAYHWFFKKIWLSFIKNIIYHKIYMLNSNEFLLS